jgi:hypothetical protein
LRKRLQKFCRISTLKSSNVPIRPADLWSCPNAGSSSAPLRGSIAAEGLPRIGRISTEKRSRSCALLQSASCSENSAIRPEVSRRTLTASLLSRWGMNISPQSQTDHMKLAAQAKIQAPELVREWLTGDTPGRQIRARRHLAQFGVNAPSDAKFATI